MIRTWVAAHENKSFIYILLSFHKYLFSKYSNMINNAYQVQFKPFRSDASDEGGKKYLLNINPQIYTQFSWEENCSFTRSNFWKNFRDTTIKSCPAASRLANRCDGVALT